MNKSTGDIMKPRKPRPKEAGVPVLVRFQAELLDGVDRYIRANDAGMSRPEAVRRIVADWLQANS